MAGAVAQRLILEENVRYEFTGWIHTEGFRSKSDKAFVHVYEHAANATEEAGLISTKVIDRDVPGWQKVEFTFTPSRRCVFISCTLRAAPGAKAWFDGLTWTKGRQ
jgi:hypothetical protein